MSFDVAQLAVAWREALALWDSDTALSAPETLAQQGQGDWGGGEPLAYIDLVRRQVVVNYPLLEKIGAAGSLTAVYAHELGHHLRFPHTLGLSAALELLQKQLIPSWPHSLTNLFFDLQVNEYVGRTRAPELCAVYRGFNAQTAEPIAPYFAFYLAIYEELWGLPAGELLTKATTPAMDQAYPGWRGDARMFAQTFYALTDTYLQFVYFCSRVLRYLPEAAPQKMGGLPFSADVPKPDLDDYAGALEGNGAVDRALEEAADRKWIDEVTAKNGADPISKLNRASSPGSAIAPYKEALVARIYKRLVEQNLVKLPAGTPEEPDPFLPTVTTAWEPGDSLRSIDWTQSILTQGALAAIAPLRRELEAEPPPEPGMKGVAVEIYLDTSGSMPSPGAGLNAMTLAAQILATCAIRSGGKVKGIVYSSDFIESEWLYGEDAAREYLLNYSGGGTQYPFPRLVELAEERADVLRVVISDSDFLDNVAEGFTLAPDPAKVALTQSTRRLMAGIERSKLFVALLSLWDPKAADAPLATPLRHPKFRLATVTNPAELPQAAARLAQAFWGK